MILRSNTMCYLEVFIEAVKGAICPCEKGRCVCSMFSRINSSVSCFASKQGSWI